jgi:hypothetical protein
VSSHAWLSRALKHSAPVVAVLALTATSVAATSEAVGAESIGGAAAAPSSWSAPESDALTAIASYAGVAPTDIGPLSPEEDSSLTTQSGQLLSVAERSFDASIGGVPSQIILTWLDQSQVIATYITFGSPFVTTSLVLQPGTPEITGAYSPPTDSVIVPTQSQSSLSSAHGGATVRFALAVQHSSRSRRHHRSKSARLSAFEYAGGCEEYIDPPGAEESEFGELVYGIAGFVNDSCNGTQALYVALQWESTQQNDLEGAQGNPDNGGFGAITYWPCYAISGTNSWYTNGLFDVFGSYYSYQQGPVYLSCSDT